MEFLWEVFRWGLFAALCLWALSLVFWFLWGAWYAVRVVRALPMALRVWSSGLTVAEQEDLIR